MTDQPMTDQTNDDAGDAAETPPRVLATDAALELIRELKEK